MHPVPLGPRRCFVQTGSQEHWAHTEHGAPLPMCMLPCPIRLHLQNTCHPGLVTGRAAWGSLPHSTTKASIASTSPNSGQFPVHSGWGEASRPLSSPFVCLEYLPLPPANAQFQHHLFLEAFPDLKLCGPLPPWCLSPHSLPPTREVALCNDES